MTDHSELKRLAERMKGWDKMSECWPCDENGPDWQVGRLDEDDDRWPLLTVDSEQYDQEQDAPMIAQYYAAANPAAVLALIAEVERLSIREDVLENLCDARFRINLDLEAERDKLKAENEALRKDAERYRFLKSRTQQADIELAVCLHDKRTQVTVFLDGEYVDSQTDIAMNQEVKP